MKPLAAAAKLAAAKPQAGEDAAELEELPAAG